MLQHYLGATTRATQAAQMRLHQITKFERSDSLGKLGIYDVR
jgi:hypothetical protein